MPCVCSPAEQEADRKADANDQAQFFPIRKWSEAVALGRNFDDANWNSRDVAAASASAEAIGNASRRYDRSVSH